MVKHTGKKPFKCEVCNIRFTQKSNMKHHMKRSHGYGKDPGASAPPRRPVSVSLILLHSGQIHQVVEDAMKNRPFSLCGVSEVVSFSLSKSHFPDGKHLPRGHRALKGVSEHLNDSAAPQGLPIRRPSLTFTVCGSSLHDASHYLLRWTVRMLTLSLMHTHTRCACALAFSLQAGWSCVAGELCRVLHQLLCRSLFLQAWMLIYYLLMFRPRLFKLGHMCTSAHCSTLKLRRTVQHTLKVWLTPKEVLET